jgi:hypothetical protein
LEGGGVGLEALDGIGDGGADLGANGVGALAFDEVADPVVADAADVGGRFPE